MKAFLWSAALCLIGASAAPSSVTQKRNLAVSQDGHCGASSGTTCLGSFLGDCCSKAGVCGNTVVYCGQGCQSEYGNCNSTINELAISNDGTCGDGVTCQDSIWGDCCSASGLCGSTSNYCGSGCNSDLGLCASTAMSSTESTIYQNTTSTTSALTQTTTNPTCPKSNGTVYVAASLNEYEVDCGFDRPGNNIKVVQVYSNTISKCIAECEATTGCVDIIMSGTACYLKSTIARSIKSTGLRGARLFRLGPQTSTSASTPSSSISSFSLPSAAGTTSSTASVTSPGSSFSPAPIATSTNPTCPRSNATEFVATSGAIYMIECYMDRTGNDLTSVQIYSNRIADCINKCDSTFGCVDISMSGTACYLKTKANPIVSQNTQVRGARLIKAAPSSSSSSSAVSSDSSLGVSAIQSTSVNLTASQPSNSPAPSGASAAPSLSANLTTSTSTSEGSSTSLNATSIALSTFDSSTPVISANTSSLSVVLSTGSPPLPLSSGVSSYIPSTSSSSAGPYGNETDSYTSIGPTVPIGTGFSTSLLSLSTGRSVSSSSIQSSPYGNETSSSTFIGPTGTGITSAPLSTGVASSAIANSTSSTIVQTNSAPSTATKTTSSPTVLVNSTSPTSTSALLITAPLTSAPLTTGASSGVTSISSSTGVYTNSTTAVNGNTVISTTSHAFTAGGISSGVPLATNTTACSTRPTSTNTCVPCEGQGDGTYCGFTAETNSYENTPITCNTVTVNLEITECTISPDGFERSALCINGQTPGPLIEADWGDTIVAHVTNSMSLNGTSIHWHGMRQLNSSEMDGVVSVTQCPLAPGQSQTYTFTASNYGFSWYHSHLTLQAYEGAFGPMWVHGPQTQDADVNAGSLVVTDWSHTPVDDMYYEAEINGVRTMDTGLINGMNVYGEDGSSDQTGERYTVPTEFVPGQTYMFNVLNAAIQSTYKFYIDGHNMTVISNDYVPIVPYETDVLNINIGQRYQVIVTANQDVGDYWLRFDNQNACASTTYSDNIKGIIHYSGSSRGTPTSAAYNYTRKYAPDGVTMLGTCEDEPLASLVPAAAMDVGAEDFEVEHSLVVSNSNPLNLYRWYLDGTTFQANWDNPTLYSVVNNNTIPDYSGNLAIELPNLGEWVYLIIETAVPLGHPIHLHGHDFHVLASGYGTYDDSVELNLKNPPRRDVAFMPGDGPTGQGGFLVIAFFTDNPGVFLAHCHIGWHVSMGFALQFIEAQDQISVSNTCLLNDVCDTWRDWADSQGIHTDDSGV